MEGKTVKKRRKYSKKSKKNLRKYTDIRDVEEFLEEQRFQERTGGLVKDKADDELFFIQKEEGVEDAGTLRSQRRKRGKKSSSGDGEEEGVSARYRAILGVVDSSEDEQEYDVGLRYADKRRRERRELAAAVGRRLKKSRLKPPTRDLWADSDEVSHKDIPDEHYLRVTRKLPVKKPSSVGAKPSALDNVSIPPPGASYNPAFDDHQDLLRSAVEVEAQKVTAEEKLNKRLQMTPMTASERDQVWQDEMMEGLIDSEGEEEEKGGSEGEGEMPPNKRPVLAESKKTLQQRRRQRERREKERQRLELKLAKAKMNDVYRLRSLKKEIVGEESAIARKIKKREELQKEELYRTKRLGRTRYVAPDINVQLSSEISGALRSLKPEGSIAVDRFKSFQQRNMIPPKHPFRKHRKYKLKIKEKRSARLPEETGDLQK